MSDDLLRVAATKISFLDFKLSRVAAASLVLAFSLAELKQSTNPKDSVI